MNILNGDSAGGSFKKAFPTQAKTTFIFRDVLSCGALKKFVDIDDWIQFRENYWNSILDVDPIYPVSFHDHSNEFCINLDAFKSSENVNLWLGLGLSDQLILAFIVYLIDKFNLNLNKLSIYQFTDLGNRKWSIRGLGELTPDQIRQCPKPHRLNENQASKCLNVWNAITNNDPEEYLNLINSKDDTELPILFSALKVLLYRYPSLANGLSHQDETLLNCAKSHKPRAARIIGHSLTADSLANDVVGDSYSFSRLRRLAHKSLKQPPLSINSLELPMRETEVDILPFGLEVLKKNRNMIAVNGVDDWVGGVHLDSTVGDIWFRKDDDLLYKAI